MSFMSRKVLVLNADYRALSVCSVYKAFLLTYLKKAEMVTTVEGKRIRTVSRSFEVPSIIRLHTYINIPFKNVMLTRYNIFKRDGYRCLYCSATENLTIDHVLPRSRGGTSVWTNLVTACRKCNSKKGNRLPEEAGMKLPYQPYRPSFIVFIRDFSEIGDESWLPYLQVKQTH